MPYAEGRLDFFPIGGQSLALPCFFPSISTVKGKVSPLSLIQILARINYPLFLFSAYDFHHALGNEQPVITKILDKTIREGSIVLMDSGNYEGYWLRDDNWKQSLFHGVLSNSVCSLAFSYDKYRSKNIERLIDEIERNVLRDQKKLLQGTIIPIIHGPEDRLPYIVRKIAERLHPVMIAVPERELGDGMIARMKKMQEIRKVLNDTGSYYPVHLLGTGNPLSILLYTVCGADSFDGLEWCQTTVDSKTALLYHFQQREFLQTDILLSPDIPYSVATLCHNLVFYGEWMVKIQQAIQTKNLFQMSQDYVPREFHKYLKGYFEGVS